MPRLEPSLWLRIMTLVRGVLASAVTTVAPLLAYMAPPWFARG